jgi:glycosyltransferase involved in cell wall biosynthesis
MRVGLIIYGGLDSVSGGYLYDRKLVEYLRRQGLQAEIISLPWRTYGVHLSHNFSRALLGRLRRASLDLLLQDELNHPSLFWLNRQLRKQVRYPILAIVHHLRCSEARPAWQNRIYRWLEQRYLTTVDGFIFNSQTTRSSVEELVGPALRAIVAYPGRSQMQFDLTPAQIARRARQPGPLRLLFVGNLIPRKGLHVLLQGLSTLRKDGWHLEVVGSLEMEPAYVRRIRHQMESMGLADQVTLSGFLPDTELATRLAGSHLLTVPSSYEGFGTVYLEGMGAGLPAIASTAGAAHEIIDHGHNGFLVPPAAPAPLAQHVGALIEDRERLIQMSLAAIERFGSFPTWSQSSERIFQFLQTW